MPCTNHPLVDTGLVPCWVCARPFCPDCVVEFQDRTLCAECKAAAVARLEAGQSVDPTTGDQLAPWERRSELGLVAAFVQTLRGVMLEPVRFFERLDKAVTRYDSIAFALIVHVLGAISGFFVGLAFQGAMSAFTGGKEGATMLLFQGAFGIVGLIFSPLVGLLMLLIFSGAQHLVLVISKTARLPYHQTMRGNAYAWAPMIVAVVPIVGPYAAYAWSVVAQVFMIQKMHRTSLGIALFAVLVPYAVLCCCTIGLFGAIVGFAAGVSR